MLVRIADQQLFITKDYITVYRQWRHFHFDLYILYTQASVNTNFLKMPNLPVSAGAKRVKRHISSNELFRGTCVGSDAVVGRLGRRGNESVTPRTFVLVTDVSPNH